MEINKTFPSVVKYMGSKTEVLDLIEEGINYLDRDYDYVCDLFAGSATLSGALRGRASVISNDIQHYSEVFSKAYLSNYNWNELPSAEFFYEAASERVGRFYERFPEFKDRFDYNREFTVDELNEYEDEQRALINRDDFREFDNYYLFVKDYSGTYWGFEQCLWIDSYRCVIDRYRENEAFYCFLLTCLMYAMAYNSQSTGHYAQYRIPDKDSSKDDILIYRRKSLKNFFESKFAELKDFTENTNPYGCITYAGSDIDCLNLTPDRSLIYADPPYCFVHYSRFYHALETLVRYDYPEVKFKGRYRNDRYQSEYCISTEVGDAFKDMFSAVKRHNDDLILSYSNSDTNTIHYTELIRICCNVFAPQITEARLNGVYKRCQTFFNNNRHVCRLVGNQPDYEIVLMKKPYNHSRMGRTETKTIPVTEIIIIAKCLQ